jgi:hypothetical protein
MNKRLAKLNSIGFERGKIGLSNMVIAASVFVVNVVANSPVQASNITLNFNTLPSTQGWTYLADGNTATETDIFSLSNGVLRQNTLGSGDGINSYTLANVIDSAQPFTLSWRSRVLQQEFVLTPQNFFGFGLTVNNSSQRFALGFGTNEIGIAAFQTLAGSFDNTIFHDYRLEGSFITGNSRFYIDDVFIANLALLNGATPNAANGLFFGDATGFTNALAEITAYRLSQGDLSESVPEPSSIASILSLGLFGIGAIVKRKF